MEVVRAELAEMGLSPDHALAAPHGAGDELPRDARRRAAAPQRPRRRRPSTIVLVHGWKQSHRLWDETSRRCPSATASSPTTCAAWASPTSRAARYDFDEHADDLAAVIAELALRDVTLVGWSMGCSVSLQYLASPRPRRGRPARADQRPAAADDRRGLPARDAGGGRRGRARGSRGALADARARVRRGVDPRPAPRPGRMAARHRAPDPARHRAARGPRTARRSTTARPCGRSPMPVLAAYGRADPYYPTALADWIAANAPRGEQVIFEHSAHCIPFEEGPRFRAELEAFIARHPAAEPRLRSRRRRCAACRSPSRRCRRCSSARRAPTARSRSCASASSSEASPRSPMPRRARPATSRPAASLPATASR